MRPPTGQVSSTDLPPVSPEWSCLPGVEAHQGRNLCMLALHQVVLRTGWIFKTESVIMPAFLDMVAGTGWVRGFLPVLNRFGQSVPPVFLAEHVKALRHKKRALAACAMLMSVPFGVLSATWFLTGGEKRPWVAILFLAMYLAFFVFNGLYHLSFGTVQGKLIGPTRRGFLLTASTFWGSLPAMFLAWWLLSDWLRLPDGGFGYIFGFTSICFLLSGVVALLMFEPGDPLPHARLPRPNSLADTVRTLRSDVNLRRLVLVAMLFGSALIIFPHYQALARQRLGLGGARLMVWVIVQNGAVGAFSLLVGPLADRQGYRLTLRMLIFAAAIGPAFAASLPHWPGGVGKHLFWTVFIPLGITPLVLRALLNYALEISAPSQHPRYLSTVSLCLAVPFVFSPLIGWLIDVTSFELVFHSAAGLIALGGLLTFTLEEPRHHAPRGEALEMVTD